jgi:hypothetical protein
MIACVFMPSYYYSERIYGNGLEDVGTVEGWMLQNHVFHPCHARQSELLLAQRVQQDAAWGLMVLAGACCCQLPASCRVLPAPSSVLPASCRVLPAPSKVLPASSKVLSLPREILFQHGELFLKPYLFLFQVVW